MRRDEGRSGSHLLALAATWKRLQGMDSDDRGVGIARGGSIMTPQCAEELWIPLYEKD